MKFRVYVVVLRRVVLGFVSSRVVCRFSLTGWAAVRIDGGVSFRVIFDYACRLGMEF